MSHVWQGVLCVWNSSQTHENPSWSQAIQMSCVWQDVWKVRTSKATHHDNTHWYVTLHSGIPISWWVSCYICKYQLFTYWVHAALMISRTVQKLMRDDYPNRLVWTIWLLWWCSLMISCRVQRLLCPACRHLDHCDFTFIEACTVQCWIEAPGFYQYKRIRPRARF